MIRFHYPFPKNSDDALYTCDGERFLSAGGLKYAFYFCLNARPQLLVLQALNIKSTIYSRREAVSTLYSTEEIAMMAHVRENANTNFLHSRVLPIMPVHVSVLTCVNAIVRRTWNQTKRKHSSAPDIGNALSIEWSTNPSMTTQQESISVCGCSYIFKIMVINSLRVLWQRQNEPKDSPSPHPGQMRKPTCCAQCSHQCHVPVARKHIVELLFIWKKCSYHHYMKKRPISAKDLLSSVMCLSSFHLCMLTHTVHQVLTQVAVW